MTTEKDEEARDAGRKEGLKEALSVAEDEQRAAEKELGYGGLAADTRTRARVRKETAEKIGRAIRRKISS